MLIEFMYQTVNIKSAKREMSAICTHLAYMRKKASSFDIDSYEVNRDILEYANEHIILLFFCVHE